MWSRLFSGSSSPVYHLKGPVQWRCSFWGVRKWHWDRVSSEHFGPPPPPVQYHSTNVRFIFIYISPFLYDCRNWQCVYTGNYQKRTPFLWLARRRKNLSPCKAAFPCSRIKGVNGSLPMFQYLYTVLDQILTSLIAIDLCVWTCLFSVRFQPFDSLLITL